MSTEEKSFDEMTPIEMVEYLERKFKEKTGRKIAAIIPHDVIYGGNWLHEGRKKTKSEETEATEGADSVEKKLKGLENRDEAQSFC